jgi:hypothetical protein
MVKIGLMALRGSTIEAHPNWLISVTLSIR